MTRGLFATDLGEGGPRLVFLHGLFGQGKNWTAIAKALSDAARVTLLDLPNHGRSAWTDTFSYPGMAAEVATLLRVRYPKEPVTLVGHSMGGKVAMMLALEHAELVRRLCVVDVSPVRYDTLSSFAQYVSGMRALDLSTLATRAEADRSLERWIPDPTVRGFLLQNLRRVPNPGAGAGWQWQMNLDLLGDRLPELGDWPEPVVEPYRGPVLWIAGARSDYVRPQFVPAMRALFPRARLVTIKDAGHWVHAEQPEILLTVLRRFVAPEAADRSASASSAAEEEGVARSAATRSPR